MLDLAPTITAKSDQLNADDLIAGDLVITISDVKAGNSAEQPVKIYHDKGQPYIPCKTMRRVIVAAWGSDSSQYMGRSMQLYRDASVKWGGQEVGGIRIRAMSHIKAPLVLALTVTRGAKKPFQVDVLRPQVSLLDKAKEAASWGLIAYQEFFEGLSKADKHSLLAHHEELKNAALKADGAGDEA